MIATPSSSTGVVSPASLRASFSAFSSTSLRDFSLRLPAFASGFSAFSSVSASSAFLATLAFTAFGVAAPSIAAVISATVFLRVTFSYSFLASASNSGLVFAIMISFVVLTAV